MKKLHSFTVVTTILGVSLLLYSGYSLIQANEFIKNSIKVNGSVTEINFGTLRDTKGDLHSYASSKVRFSTLEGKSVEFKPDDIDTNPPPYKTGQILTVYYDANDPNKAKVDSLTSLWFPTAASGFVGFIVFLLGLASTKFRWSSSRKKDKFDVEFGRQTHSLLKYFLLPFFLLSITTIAYIELGKNLATNPLLKIPFFIAAALCLVLIAKAFIDIKASANRQDKGLKEETQDYLLRIKIRSYRNPLILKYQILFPIIPIGIGAAVLYLLILWKVGPLIALIAFIFVVLGGTLEILSMFADSLTAIIGKNSLSFEEHLLWTKSIASTKWSDILPYFKRIEFREKDKCVIIYTSMPPAYQEDNFSPYKYFLHWYWGLAYANFFIPVNTKEEAEQVIKIIEQIRSDRRQIS